MYCYNRVVTFAIMWILVAATVLGGISLTTSAMAKQVCVQSQDGHRFCYEPLPPDENCLKPMHENDPPLCKGN